MDLVKMLHIDIDFKRGAKFLDQSGELCGIYDTKQKTWRHLNFFNTLVTCIVECLALNLLMAKLNSLKYLGLAQGVVLRFYSKPMQWL